MAMLGVACRKTPRRRPSRMRIVVTLTLRPAFRHPQSGTTGMAPAAWRGGTLVRMNAPDAGARTEAPKPPSARTHALLERPIGQTLLRMAAPAMLLMVFQTAVAIADTRFIGQLGTEPLAGLAIVFPLVMLMNMLSGGAMGGGITSAIARALGAGDAATARSVVVHAFVIALTGGVLCTLLMLTAGRAIFTFLGGRGPALEHALVYSNTVFAGSMLVWVSNMCGSILRGTGNTTLPAAILISAAVVHVPLAAVLVPGALGIPSMGMRGAAVAYLCALVVSTVLGAVAIFRPGSALRPLRSDLVLHGAMFGRLLRVGGLSMLSALQSMSTAVILTGFAGRYGTAALAGYGVGARLELLMMPLAFSFGQALVPMVGTALGAGDLKRAKRAAYMGAGFAAALCGSIGLIAAVFPQAWTGIFSDDPAVRDYAAVYLHWVAPMYPVLGVAVALYFASQGAGRVLWPVLGATARLVTVIVGGTLLIKFGAPFWALCVLMSVAVLFYAGITAASVHRARWV
ncbi:MAG: MATE family efflux transporter [Burkholderiaceae bacterium]|nr:MAG: MATE family efflux transporter [Burkholderiaceae bacterium]